jgi:CheY-like chemotaxis protein
MSKCILVIEDQADNRQIIRDMLAPTDYEITEAENGEQALAAVARQRPDLILMDIRRFPPPWSVEELDACFATDRYTACLGALPTTGAVRADLNRSDTNSRNCSDTNSPVRLCWAGSVCRPGHRGSPGYTHAGRRGFFNTVLRVRCRSVRP